MVVDAAGGHGVERPQRHPTGGRGVGAPASRVAQAQLDEGGPGEFRRRAVTAPLGVEAGAEPRNDLAEHGAGVERTGTRSPRQKRCGAGAPTGTVRTARLDLAARTGLGLAPASASPRLSASRSSLRTAPTSASACARTCSRSPTHASPSACTTRRNDGMP